MSKDAMFKEWECMEKYNIVKDWSSSTNKFCVQKTYKRTLSTDKKAL